MKYILVILSYMLRKGFHRKLLTLIVLCPLSSIHADMMISPTRVLIDENNSSTTMMLRNSSTGPRTYRLSWEDKRAKEEGGYTKIAEDEQWPSAKEMVRFSPRQITVGAGENQTVRFSWRPSADLPAGEYRSHLLLQVIPDTSEPASTLESPVDENGVGIQVFMQMSFSVPVVVRHNTDVPEVSIASVKPVPLNDGTKMGLELIFNRSGNASSFGKVSVEMQRNADSPVELIGEYRELSIYQEVNRRKITVPLRDPSIPGNAVIRIAYDGLKEYDGILWDEKVIRAQ